MPVPNDSPPPRLAVRLLHAALDDSCEPYVGDLLERFEIRAARDGVARARRSFWRDTAVALVRLPWRRAAAPAHHVGDPMLVALFDDLRHAARRLRRAPSFTLLAVLTLASGIGATTAVFSVAYTALLRPLPYRDADRLVDVAESTDGGRTAVSAADLGDWRAQSRAMELGAWMDATSTLTEGGAPEQLPAGVVTEGFFHVLGATPSLGRAFSAAEWTVGGPKAVLLSDALWRRRFGADPRVVGRVAHLDGDSYTIVGVMPRGFDFPSHAQLWTPTAFPAEAIAAKRGARFLRVIGRLRDGTTMEAARAELDAVAARLAVAYPRTNAGYGVELRTLRDATVGSARPALVVLLGAVGLLLLLTCANVANLLLVRAARREHDRVVRAALGASRGQLASAVLSEALLLAGGGGALGVAVAWWGTRALDATLRVARPQLAESHVDGPVLAFAVVTAAATALAFGLLPAIGASRLRTLGTVLRSATVGGARPAGTRWRRGWRLRGSLVVAQVAIATLLLCGAAVLGESFRRLRHVELGFAPRGVWTASFALPDTRYAPERRAVLVDALLARLRATPGVRAAGATSALPLSGAAASLTLADVDGVPEPEETARSTQLRVVTDDYFRAVGMRVRRGRAIAAADRANGPLVIVVNEALGRLLWPGQDPVGHRLTLGGRLGLGGERAGGTVVGVVGDVRDDAVQRDAQPEAFVAYAQFPVGNLSVALRAPDAPRLPRLVATHVAALDPDVALYQERALDTLVDDAVAEPRLYSLLFGAFAGAALLLAGVGVYGVVALAVAQRTREFGVRVALGARPGDVVRLVLRHALAPVAVGLGAGLAGALASSRALGGLLYGVRATEPAALAVVCAVVAVAAAAAVYLPTRRATSVAPTRALREEG